MRRDIDGAVARLARRQHNVFTRAQVFKLGGTNALITRRLRAGIWIELAPGVYALPGGASSWHRQLKAAELSLPGSAVARRSAAALFGVHGFRPGRIQLVVPHDDSRRTKLAAVHQSIRLETTVREGIVVTTLAQTVHDLASERNRPPMTAVIAAALAAGLQIDDLRQRSVVMAASRRRGLRELYAAVHRYDDEETVAPTVLEALLRSAIEAAGLVGVRYQYDMAWATEDDPHRVDAAVPARRVILEADSRQWHARLEAFESDRERDNQAVRHGWSTMRLTWRDLTRDFDATVALLREVLVGPIGACMGPSVPECDTQ